MRMKKSRLALLVLAHTRLGEAVFAVEDGLDLGVEHLGRIWVGG